MKTNFMPIIESISESPEGCTLEKIRVISPSMGREIKAVVILPPEYKDHPEKKYPILYTLNGADAPYDTYTHMAPLRQALKAKPMIVTCMDGDKGSWYIDSHLQVVTQPKTQPVKSLFTTFFFDEFIPTIDQNFRTNTRERMVTGFSMGGYGAFYYMFTKPEMFVSISSLSGGWYSFTETPTDEQKPWYEPILGPYEENKSRYDALDCYSQLRKLLKSGQKLPAIFLGCGAEDQYFSDTRDMGHFLKMEGVPFEYSVTKGIHDFVYWKGASAAVIDFHWRSLRHD